MDEQRLIKIKLFQSTLLQEERQGWNSLPEICAKFQSTLLQEERQRRNVHSKDREYFNPRSYKRSDVQ